MLSSIYAKMKVRIYRPLEHRVGNTMATNVVGSGAIGERAEYHQGAADAGALEPSIPLQFAIQLSGYRIPVSFYTPFYDVTGLADTKQGTL